MGMRRMKTIRDTPIRKTAARSFLIRNNATSTNHSTGIRSGRFSGKSFHAGDLRAQIIVSLPERQRRLLMKMPARKREKLILDVEKKIDRRMKKYRQSVENDPRTRRTLRSARKAEKKLQDAEVRRKISDTVRIPVMQGKVSTSAKDADARAMRRQLKTLTEEATRSENPVSGTPARIRNRHSPGKESARGMQSRGNHGHPEIAEARDSPNIPEDIRDLTPSDRRIIREETADSLTLSVPAPSSGKPGRTEAEKQAGAGKTVKEIKAGQSSGKVTMVPIQTRKSESFSAGPAGNAAPAAVSSSAATHLSPDEIWMQWEEKGQAKALYYKELSHRVKKQYRKELFHSLAFSELKDSTIRKMERKMQKEQAEGSAGRELEDSTLAIGELISAGGKTGRAARKTSAALKEALDAVRRSIQAKAWTALAGSLLAVLIPFLLILLILISVISGVSTSVSAVAQDDVYSSVEAGELIAYAESWVGITKYAWGEGRAYETDWQDFTDCSGFVHGVFSHFGYEIGGDTYQMETHAGHVVGTDSVQNAVPGDILLWFRDAGCSAGNSYHVSIYIGNGKMVHCTAGGNSQSRTRSNPGIGVIVSNIWSGSHFQVRRILTESLDGSTTQGSLGGRGTGGHRIDATPYSQSDMELIWAIVAQEDNGSYAGALAVISTAMNRVESPKWSYEGSNALAQLKAPGQFCYSNDSYWRARLGGNVPQYVKQAVYDCLKKGIRNHTHTSFRSHYGSNTPGAVQIGGGNWYFD